MPPMKGIGMRKRKEARCWDGCPAPRCEAILRRPAATQPGTGGNYGNGRSQRDQDEMMAREQRKAFG